MKTHYLRHLHTSVLSARSYNKHTIPNKNRDTQVWRGMTCVENRGRRHIFCHFSWHKNRFYTANKDHFSPWKSLCSPVFLGDFEGFNRFVATSIDVLHTFFTTTTCMVYKSWNRWKFISTKMRIYIYPSTKYKIKARKWYVKITFHITVLNVENREKVFLGVKKCFTKATFEIKDSRLAIIQDGYFLSNNAGSVIFYLACDSNFADLICCHSPACAADCLGFLPLSVGLVASVPSSACLVCFSFFEKINMWVLADERRKKTEITQIDYNLREEL